MKLANRILTIGITSIATPLLSGLVFSLILGGVWGELLPLFFIVSFPVVLCLGTPYSLLINHYFKQSGVAWFLLKLVLHGVGGLLMVFIWALLAGGKEAFASDAILFYLAALLNATVYFIIFSLLKLTGRTDFD